jgi:hypothetical protein
VSRWTQWHHCRRWSWPCCGRVCGICSPLTPRYYLQMAYSETQDAIYAFSLKTAALLRTYVLPDSPSNPRYSFTLKVWMKWSFLIPRNLWLWSSALLSFTTPGKTTLIPNYPIKRASHEIGLTQK